MLYRTTALIGLSIAVCKMERASWVGDGSQLKKLMSPSVIFDTEVALSITRLPGNGGFWGRG